MSDQWVVKDRLAIGRKVEGDRYLRCNPMLICTGDFVDVAIELDIATSRNANGETATRVQSILHVIQLVTAENVATVNFNLTRSLF